MARVIAPAVIMVLFLCNVGFSQQFDPKDLETRNLLLEAIKSRSPFQREAKLQEVLKISPENYYALIQLGELELGREGKASLKANEFFLRAALAQPQRPEAYLCLANTCYSTGYIAEGTRYMMMAIRGPYSKQSYESISLQAQNFLDTCNYDAAIVAYADAALVEDSPHYRDPQLLRKLYQAAALARPPVIWVWKKSGLYAGYESPEAWVPYVLAKFMGVKNTKEYSQFLNAIKEAAKKASVKHQITPVIAEKLYNIQMYRIVVKLLRDLVPESRGVESIIEERFALGKQFYNFGICESEKFRVLASNLDLYDVFVEASVPDPAKRKELLEQLAKKKEEALQAVAGIKDPKEKGKALFKWLRENLIKTYDAVDGVTAEGVITDNKYLCLSGAILYTLIGRDAGLNVNGFVEPGHAYAVMHDRPGDRINVQTTFPVRESAETPAGFNAPDTHGRETSGDLRSRPDIVGEVSPLDLVSYQFTNVGINKLDNLTLNKYGADVRATLKKLGLKQQQIDLTVNAWRLAMLPPGVTFKIMAHMAQKNETYHAQLMKQIDGLIGDFSRARAFNPFNRVFLDQIEAAGTLYADLFVSNPASSMVKRLRAQLEKERGTIKKELDQKVEQEAESKGAPPKAAAATESGAGESEAVPTEEQESIQWAREKQIWLTSLKKLEKMVNDYPCSDRLKRILSGHCIKVAKVVLIAKYLNIARPTGTQLGYNDLVDELNRIRMQHFASIPELSVPLSAAISQVL